VTGGGISSSFPVCTREKVANNSVHRSRRRWEDNVVKMYFKEIDWIHLAQDRDQW
jgi:hypothetical protein